MLNDSGRVDVDLLRESLHIACEVSVTAGDSNDLVKLEKCMKNNYEHILFVASDKNVYEDWKEDV